MQGSGQRDSGSRSLLEGVESAEEGSGGEEILHGLALERGSETVVGS